MTTFTFLRDPEAAVYAIEAASCLLTSLTTGNHAQAALDAIGLYGWIANATGLGAA